MAQAARCATLCEEMRDGVPTEPRHFKGLGGVAGATDEPHGHEGRAAPTDEPHRHEGRACLARIADVAGVAGVAVVAGLECDSLLVLVYPTMRVTEVRQLRPIKGCNRKWNNAASAAWQV